MSLINQVLKDLDKRNSSSETGKLLSGEVRNPPLPKRGVKLLIPIILLLAAAGGGFFAWKKYFQPVAPPVSVVQAPPVLIKQPAPPTSAPQAPPAAEAVPVVSAASVPTMQAETGADVALQSTTISTATPPPEIPQPPTPAIAGTAIASFEASLVASAGGVLLNLDFPNPIKYKVFTLSGPNRVVVDLEGVDLSPELEQLPTKLTSMDSDIAEIRVGRFTPTVTRIVLGLKGALPDVKSSVQSAGNGGQRLMVHWGQSVDASMAAAKSPPQHFLGMEKELKPQRPSVAVKGDDGVSDEKRERRKIDSAHLRSSRALSAKMDSSTEDTTTAKQRREKSSVATIRGGSAEPLKIISEQQRSDNFYRQAIAMLQQGRVVEAKEILRQSLAEASSNHAARQLLVGLLVEEGQQGEAVNLLRDGLKLGPEQAGFSMALARLQIEASDRDGALTTLQEGLQYAGDDAEYHAFLAALLQREDRHEAAVAHYLVALKSNPAMPNWLIGIGISLQTQGKLTDAAEAFNRAKRTGALTPDLAQFVDQRIGQIKQQLH